MINKEILSRTTGLAKQEAGIRLVRLASSGILKTFYSGMKARYTLKEELPPAKEKLPLRPYLSTEDLFNLFIANEYRLSLQDVVYMTGLNAMEAKKQLRLLSKEEVIEKTFGSFCQLILRFT